MTKASSVLLVEDDPDVAWGLREALEFEGYAVHAAANGQEALQHLRGGATAPCVILLDWKMPVMGGSHFLHELTQSPQERPAVIVLTASSNTDIQAFDSDVSVMRKPVDLDDLLEAIRAHCA